MNHQKITAVNIYKYLGVLLSGLLFLFSFTKFQFNFKECQDWEEDCAYLFSSNPSSAQGLVREGQSQGIDCETFRIRQEQNLHSEELSRKASGYIVQLSGNRLEELYLHTSEPSCIVSTQLAAALFGSHQAVGKHIVYQETPYIIKHILPCETPILFLGQNPSIPKGFSDTSSSPHSDTTVNEPTVGSDFSFEEDIAISIIHERNALNDQRIQHFFQTSDVKIDVKLLKWLVALITFFFFLCILALFFLRLKQSRAARWTYFFCLAPWLCYLKLELFTDAAKFPFWILPGKWSDLEGFRTLWENLLTQLSTISRFRNYPILCKYYQGLSGCSFFLLLCFLSLWVFLQNTLSLFFCFLIFSFSPLCLANHIYQRNFI